MAMIYHALKINYLTEEQLAGFDKYKYRCKDTSPLAIYVMHPFWNWALKFFPLWLAPNLMTFTGWLLSVSNFLLLSYYDWDYTSSNAASQGIFIIPQWVWLFCAISQFCSHTLDGLDGKQARRTGSSSPLGELFDHGLDSSEALLMPFVLLSVFGIGPHCGDARLHYFALLSVCFGFYTSHWEKYNTSVLYLPWSYDTGQLGILVVFLLTGAFSQNYWRTVVHGDWLVAHIFPLLLIGVSTVGTLPISAYNVYRMRKSNPEWCRSFPEGLMPYVPISITFALFTYWALQSPTNILDKEPRMFYVTVGIVFANIACRLIVCQLSSSICERFNPLIYPLLLLVPCVILKIVNEKNCLYLYGMFVILAHIHYGVCVVNQLCDHLDIRCFKVSTPKATTEKVANGTVSNHKAD